MPGRRLLIIFTDLGGRDITVDNFNGVYNELERMAETHEVRDNYRYIGLRE